VVMVRCDTALSEDVSSLLHSCTTAFGLPPLAGAINSGGVLADSTIANQTAAGLRTVFAPKVASTLAMQGRAAAFPVNPNIVFSSIASLLGSTGQANYAAANAALEGWAAAMTASGSNAIAVQWGAWAAGNSTAPGL